MYNSMPIFTAQEIKVIEAHTILHEPITSIDLMEKAAIKCADWILKHYVSTQSFKVFCGLGNNGGDGLAIARLLIHNGFTVIRHRKCHMHIRAISLSAAVPEMTAITVH